MGHDASGTPAGDRGSGTALRSRAAAAGALASLTAAACVTTVIPLLGVSPGAVTTGLISQFGGVSGNLLAECITRTWDRWRGKDDPLTHTELRDLLTQALREALSDETRAGPIRADLAVWLNRVGTLDAALTTAYGDDAFRQQLADGFTCVAATFTEFARHAQDATEHLTRIEAGQRHGFQTTDDLLLAILDHLTRPTTTPITPSNAAASQTGKAPSFGHRPEAEKDAPGRQIPCPYPGLKACTFTDAVEGRFHGRDLAISQVLTRMTDHARNGQPLLVLGPSGIGKSSLLLAGVLLTLSRGLLPITGSVSWPRVHLTPTHDPVNELATAVATRAHLTVGTLPDAIRTRPDALRTVIHQLLATHHEPLDDATDNKPARLVLIIDQLEELFDPRCPHEDRIAVIRNILHATRSEDGQPPPALVVLGLRADFYAQAAAIPDLHPILQNHTYVVPAMTRDELRAAITGPARTVGLTIDGDLLGTLLTEATAHPDQTGQALPLLAHALKATFTHRDGNRLTLAGYHAVGGIAGAITKTADDIYTALLPPDQDHARRIFQTLVTLGDGVPDTRRRVPHQDLQDCTSSPDVLDRFIHARLITADENTYLLAHDALITAWPRLATWIDDDRDGLRIHAHLRDRARTWHDQGRDPGGLYRGIDLDRLHQWAARHPRNLTTTEGDLYRASLAHQDAERRAQRRRRYLLYGTLTTIAVLLIAATTGGIIAFQQRNQAQQAGDQAQQASHVSLSRQLAAQAQSLPVHQVDLASLLAIQAYHQAPTAEAEDALARHSIETGTTARTTLTGHTEPVSAVVFSPDGTTLATTSADGTARLWDARTGRHRATLTGHTSAVNAVAFSPDGTTLATSSSDDSARLWDTRTGQQRAVLTGHTSNVTSAVFSPDGATLATTSEDGTARLWDARTGRSHTALSGHTEGVWSVAFSPDGTTLATSGQDNARLWDISTGRQRATLTGHTSYITDVAFSPDGATLATGGQDNAAHLWDVGTGRSRAVLSGHTDVVIEVAFSPDGATLATTSADGTARLWDVGTGRSRAVLSGHTNVVIEVAFSPDGATLATTSDDRTARLWDVGTGRSRAVLSGHTEAVTEMAFSPDGATLATGGQDNAARLWDTRTGRSRTILTGHTEGVTSAVFSPDGTTLATTSDDRTARLWDARTGQQRAVLSGHTSNVDYAEFSPDGTTLATARGSTMSTTGDDKTARLWDVRTGRQRAVLAGHTEDVRSVMFSPDGTTLATTSADGTARLWDARTGRQRAVLTGHTGNVDTVAFSPDGTTLATSSSDNTARLWDTRTGQQRATLTGHTEGVNDVVFSPDGTTLATGSGDDTSRLWDARTGRQRAVLTGHTSDVEAVVFSPDGTVLATIGSEDNATRLWDARTGRQRAVLTGHTSNVTGLTFSPDNTTLATTGNDGTARLWDVRTGQQRAVLTGHTSYVEAVVFSPDSTTLATTNRNDDTDNDFTTRLWDTHTGHQRAVLTGHTNSVTAVAFSPDGTTLATSSTDMTVHLDPMPDKPDRAIQRLCQSLARDLTAEEWEFYLPGVDRQPTCPSRSG